jgi:LemA protein
MPIDTALRPRHRRDASGRRQTMGGLIGIAVAAALSLAVAAYVVAIYNNLVHSRNLAEEGWSGIDVQLKRRANLVPNLVETVKGYATHERETLEAVTAARRESLDAATTSGQATAENDLTHALGRLFAVAEAYPELKADAGFRQLQSQLHAIEGDLEKSRRYYNGTVRKLNTLIEQFPSNLVANQFGFTGAEYFEIEDPSERAVPSVDFGSRG